MAAAKPVVVVKVGTSTLLDKDDQPSATFGYVASGILSLQPDYDVVLVTSGAIGFGVTHMRLAERPSDKLDQLQALSMIGQMGLMSRWREAFGEMTLGQMLVTRRDLSGEQSSRLFQRSAAAVWGYGGLPIVNENDAISTDEISFGDNDQLAAEVAVQLKAASLIFLTDQDGIQANFGTDQQQRIVQATAEQARDHVVAGTATYGSGGATSKLLAAAHARDAGVAVYIAHAARPRAVQDALVGRQGTKLV